MTRHDVDCAFSVIKVVAHPYVLLNYHIALLLNMLRLAFHCRSSATILPQDVAEKCSFVLNFILVHFYFLVLLKKEPATFAGKKTRTLLCFRIVFLVIAPNS